MVFAPGVQTGRGVEVVLGCEILNRMTEARPTRVISHRQVRILSVGIVRARDDSCNNACAGKARSRGTRCRDVIFETLFETLWGTNPIRPRSAASRNRVMRGPGVTQGAKRSQGARRPRGIEPRNALFCEGRRRALDGRLSRRISEAVEAATSPGSERVACVRVGFPGTREASSSPS